MNSGIGYPSYRQQLALTAVTNGWSASYPLNNLLDLKALRQPAIASAAGPVAISFLMTGTKTVGVVALAHHNLAAGDTVRVRLYSDNNPTDLNVDGLVTDQTVAVPAIVAGYPPVLLIGTGLSSCLSGLIEISTTQTFQAGALDVADLYSWPNVTVPRQLGFNARGIRNALPGGVDANMGQWSPRIWQGSRDVNLRSEIDTTWFDFQAVMRTSQPFIWFWDLDDSTTWAREAFVVKNKPLANSAAIADNASKAAFNFEEHLA